MNDSVKNWPEASRPTEKLIREGAEKLSDLELIAVFLRTGHRGANVLTTANNLLTHVSDLRGLATCKLSDLKSVNGVGKVKFAQLQAALEIVKRQYEQALTRNSVFNSVDDVRRYLLCQLRDKRREQFAVMLLDAQHQLIAYQILFEGTLNAAAVYPRDVVHAVLNAHAAAVILVHNHPSGVCEPSQADVAITKQIKSALKLIDVSVLDHFIVADRDILSFSSRGLL